MWYHIIIDFVSIEVYVNMFDALVLLESNIESKARFDCKPLCVAQKRHSPKSWKVCENNF